jgi:hypothetical protein
MSSAPWSFIIIVVSIIKQVLEGCAINLHPDIILIVFPART